MTVPIRRKARELVMQALYLSEMSQRPLEEALPLLIEHFEASKKALNFARELISGLAPRLAELDRLIAEHSTHWRVERMAQVDRNILRVSVFELLAMPETPASVVINEAVEIANRYASEDAASFINGILDAVRRKLQRE